MGKMFLLIILGYFRPYIDVGTKIVFARCVKMVFFPPVFEAFFPYNNVGKKTLEIILTHLSALCQNRFCNRGPYIYGYKNGSKNHRKKHHFDTAQKCPNKCPRMSGLKKIPKKSRF